MNAPRTTTPPTKRTSPSRHPVKKVDEYGVEIWHLDGVLYREDGPAIVWPDGAEAWYQNDKLHRTDGPARTNPGGLEMWCIHGHLHRTDGPAITYPDGTQEWWIDGKQIPQPADPPLSTES